jgi:hypothetical protein
MAHQHDQAFTQRQKRRQRGHPPKAEPPQEETRYRLVAEAQALIRAEQDQGWTVLTTTVDVETCSDEEILRAYQDQNSTGEPGLRWIKNPAAITPMWLQEPERMAALAMLTVVGLLVYSLLQHQVRLYLQEHQQHISGHKGPTGYPHGCCRDGTVFPGDDGTGTAYSSSDMKISSTEGYPLERGYDGRADEKTYSPFNHNNAL